MKCAGPKQAACRAFYILDDSSTTLKDISTAPNPNADPDAHRVHQNMMLSNYDLFGTFENNSTKSKYKFAVTEEHGFQPSSETIGISTAFVETTLKDSDVMARVGRQSRNSGGVIGRFDGGAVELAGDRFCAPQCGRWFAELEPVRRAVQGR